MRHDQARLIDRLADDEQQIQVEGARPPTLETHPAREAFDFELQFEQCPRLERGLETERSIQVIRLRRSPGHGLVQRRKASDPRMALQLSRSRTEKLQPIS